MLIRLPTNIKNKDRSPCDLIYRYICKRKGMDWEVFRKKYSVSDVFVCQDTFNILEGLECKWLVKHNDKKFMGKKYFEKAWNTYWYLSVSPAIDNSVPVGKARFGRGK